MNKDLIVAFLLSLLLHTGMLALAFSYEAPVFDITEAPSSMEVHLTGGTEVLSVTRPAIEEAEAEPPPKISEEPPVKADRLPDEARKEQELLPPEPTPIEPLQEEQPEEAVSDRDNAVEGEPEETERAVERAEAGEEPLASAETIPQREMADLSIAPPGDEIHTDRIQGVEEMSLPAYLKNPPPVYPEKARRLGIEGTLLLEVTITEKGTCGAIAVISSTGSPLLDTAAQEAVKTWNFLPAKRLGKPIATKIRIPIVFRLEDK